MKQIKHKKPLKLTFALWLGFTLFAAGIAILFWVILYTSVQVRYINESTERLDSNAWMITEKYPDIDFENSIYVLAKSDNYFIQIISEKGNRVLLSVDNQGKDAKPQQDNIADSNVFRKLDESNGYCFYYVEDTVHNSKWAVEAIVLANENGYRKVLVISKSMADADALMEMLTSRYIWITISLMILASVVSFIMAYIFARPFQHLNKSAEQMAKGDFETEFVEEGPQEARQLAKTLALAEKEFNATEKLRRDFVANISHDMKTPLTVIKVYAEMLESFSGEIPEKRAVHLQKILTETDKLTTMINDTLELARLQSGTIEVCTSDFYIRELIDETIDRLKVKKEIDGYLFRIHASADYLVNADRNLIGRVLYNFLSNAVKFDQNTKQVDVEIKSQGGEVLISVIDHGIGIQQDLLKHIWQRYYQVDPYGENRTGMGMGLNIVSEILKSHDAPFGVDSEVGNGSTFWFMLPKSQEES